MKKFYYFFAITVIILGAFFVFIPKVKAAGFCETIIGSGKGCITTYGTLNGFLTGGSNIPADYTISGPQVINGTLIGDQFSIQYPDMLNGNYTLTYNSGGPAGAALQNITPSNIQTVSDNLLTVFQLEFVSPAYSLTIFKSGAGSGTVTSSSVSPAKINCGVYCTINFVSNTVITLIATPDANSNFAGWSGDADCLDGSVTMNAAKTCTATFNLNTLSITQSGTAVIPGTVTSSPAGINCGADCSEIYTFGTNVTLTATPSGSGSYFAGWSGGGCSGIGTCVVTMGADQMVDAKFDTLYDLAVNVTGSGQGNVTSMPAGISCGSSLGPCNKGFPFSTVVVLTPIPAANSSFAGWSGNADCLDGSVTMDVAKTCTATFNLTYTLNNISPLRDASNPGWTRDYTVSITRTAGFSNDVILSAAVTSGTASDLQLAWSPNNIIKNTGQQSRRLRITALNPPAESKRGTNYTITINAASTGIPNKTQNVDFYINQYPQARWRALGVTSLTAGQTVIFRDNGSLDPDTFAPGNTLTTFMADFNGDGTIDACYDTTAHFAGCTAPDPRTTNWNFTYNTPGVYRAKYYVYDDLVDDVTGDEAKSMKEAVSIPVTVVSVSPPPTANNQSVTTDKNVAKGITLTGNGNINDGIKISAGQVHSLVLKPDGSVWAWGNNQQGQLGDNQNCGVFYCIDPVKVKGPGAGYLSNIIDITTTAFTSYALKSDGTVWSWGYNGNGLLGNGTTGTGYVSTPVQLSGLSNVVAIEAGENQAYAIKSDGSLWSWGSNQDGQAGNGTIGPITIPVQVKGPGGVGFLTDVVKVEGGNNHSLAVKSDGTVWAWGSNSTGQLGDNTILSATTPVQVKGPGGIGFLNNIVSIAGGGSNGGAGHSLAVKSDGTVWAWGNNSQGGQLGDNKTCGNTCLVPVQVKGVGGVGNLTGIVDIAAGESTSFYLASNGNVYGAGYNGFQELYDGTTVNRWTPVQVFSSVLSGVVDISRVKSDTLALLSNEDVRGWPNGLERGFGSPPPSISYIISSLPVNGSLKDAANNPITTFPYSLGSANPTVVNYTPNTDYVGSDSFQFKVVNWGQESAAATINIMVGNSPTFVLVDSSGDAFSALNVGQTEQYDGIYDPDGPSGPLPSATVPRTSITWNSTNPSVATINLTSGLATAVGIGPTQIQGTYSGITATADLAVGVPLPPSSFTGLAVCQAPNNADVNLSWQDNSLNEDGFRVYRGTSAGFIPGAGNLILTLPANTINATDISHSVSTTYYYKIIAFNVNGDSLPASSPAVVVPSCAPTFVLVDSSGDANATVPINGTEQYDGIYDPDGPSGSAPSGTVPRTSVIWVSNNTSIATIDSSGLAQGKAQGFVQIQGTYSGITATANLTISSSCVNGCFPSGATLCQGNGVVTCGDYNLDGCFEWSSPSVVCGGGQTCLAGACVSAPIITFTAAPNILKQGQSTDLSWSVTNADSCTALDGYNGDWTGTKPISCPPSGTCSQTVSPKRTSNYTLRCDNISSGVSISKTVSITVKVLPTIYPK